MAPLTSALLRPQMESGELHSGHILGRCQISWAMPVKGSGPSCSGHVEEGTTLALQAASGGHPLLRDAVGRVSHSDRGTGLPAEAQGPFSSDILSVTGDRAGGRPVSFLGLSQDRSPYLKMSKVGDEGT